MIRSAAERERALRRLESIRGELLLPWKIRDVVIVRGGELQAAWHDRGTDRIGPVYSCTKSVLSTLIGIAIGQGAIGGVGDRLGDYMALPPGADERLCEVTLEHLLTMTPGWDWPDFDKPYKEMKKSADWCSFVLSRPFAHQPGDAFTYNSGGSHLLSAVLTKATGLSAASFARRELFGKLGFRQTSWPSNCGVNEGGAGLAMSALDLAKLGMLYAERGEWQGRRVVPAEWIEAAVSPRHKGFSHYEPQIFGSYGYHWWISDKEHNGTADLYFALGFGGQYLFVVPERALVVVIRKQLAGRHNAMLSKKLLFEHILPMYDS